MIIWTYFNRPFIMGGRVAQPTGFQCEADLDEVELGGIYVGYEVNTPKGNIVVVEKTSGAIVGSSLEEVRNDILHADTKVMEQQVAYACEELRNVNILSEADFWNTYERGK